MTQFVPFDSILDRVARLLEAPGALPADIPNLFLVRICSERYVCRFRTRLPMTGQPGTASRLWPPRCTKRWVFTHTHPMTRCCLLAKPLLNPLEDAAREIKPGVYWVDRLVTGGNWWTVRAPDNAQGANRFALYSVKGGVGRTTTAAVLAWHLARNGERVLVVDLDLESPGLSSAMLDAQGMPAFGITDWFVEDLVGQGDSVLGEMTSSPAWALDLEGDVHVAPAHGREPGEYLAKLGRVYMDTPEAWATRLERLTRSLEQRCDPTVPTHLTAIPGTLDRDSCVT